MTDFKSRYAEYEQESNIFRKGAPSDQRVQGIISSYGAKKEALLKSYNDPSHAQRVYFDFEDRKLRELNQAQADMKYMLNKHSMDRGVDDRYVDPFLEGKYVQLQRRYKEGEYSVADASAEAKRVRVKADSDIAAANAAATRAQSEAKLAQDMKAKVDDALAEEKKKVEEEKNRVTDIKNLLEHETKQLKKAKLELEYAKKQAITANANSDMYQGFIQDEKKKTEKEKKQLQDIINNANNRHVELERKNRELLNKQKLDQTAWEERLNACKKRNISCITKTKECKKKLATLENEKEQTKSYVEAQNRRIIQCESEETELQKQIAENTQTINDLEQELSRNDAAYKEITQNFKKSQTLVNGLTAKLETEKQAVKTVKEASAPRDSQLIAQLEQQIVQLTQRVEDKTKEEKTHKNALGNVNLEKKQLEEQIEKLRQKNERLKQQHEKVNTTQKESEQKLGEATEKIAVLKKQIADQQKRLNMCGADKKKAQADYNAKLQQAKEEHKRRQERTKERCKEDKKQLKIKYMKDKSALQQTYELTRQQLTQCKQELKSKYAEWRSKAKGLSKEERKNLQEQINKTGEKIKSMQEELAVNQQSRKKLQVENEKMEEQFRRAEKKYNLQEETFAKQLEQKCKECTNASRAEFEQQMAGLNKQLTTAQGKLDECQKNQNQLIEENKNYTEQLEKLQQKIDELTKNNAQIQSYLDKSKQEWQQREKEYTAAATSDADRKRHAEAQKKLEQIIQRLEQDNQGCKKRIQPLIYKANVLEKKNSETVANWDECKRQQSKWQSEIETLKRNRENAIAQAREEERAKIQKQTQDKYLESTQKQVSEEEIKQRASRGQYITGSKEFIKRNWRLLIGIVIVLVVLVVVLIYFKVGPFDLFDKDSYVNHNAHMGIPPPPLTTEQIMALPMINVIADSGPVAYVISPENAKDLENKESETPDKENNNVSLSEVSSTFSEQFSSL